MATMAKNKKQLFTNNLSSRKPTDEEISKVTEDLNSQTVSPKSAVEELEEEGEKGFHIKFPKSHYNRLSSVSKKTHIPMKYIIMQALQEYYENHNY